MTRTTHTTRAFTLVELLVAVAVVALLTIGVGRIFQSISALSSTGAAVAEVESNARIIESLMRDDFRALALVDPDKNFLVIRNRRLGDLDRDRQLDSEEVALYLTRDDAEFDQRNGFTPYQTNAQGLPLSRATTVRLDEIMFMGFSTEPGGFTSFQQDNAGRATIRAPFARLYYGHGLRPPIDVPSNNDDPTRRLFYPDGDFGSGPDAIGPSTIYQQNRFASSPTMLSDATGRNQFAGDFTLVRQPILLFGGIAAGYDTGGRRAAPLSDDQSYALYIRDHEADFRLNGLFGSISDEYPQGLSPVNLPNPRLIRHGRTDVVAQSLEDVIRWAEGLQDPATAPNGLTELLPDASPFSAGFHNNTEDDVNDPQNFDRNQIDRFLWVRAAANQTVNNGNQNNAFLHNLKGYQTALAGMLIRPIVEPLPPVLRFEDPQDWINVGQRPSEAQMDLHAILAQHCSSFEVAWSDGTRWRANSPNADPLEYRRIGESDDIPPRRILREGDIVWFDMDFTWADLHAAVGNANQAQRRFPRPNPDPEIHAFGFDETPQYLNQFGFPNGIPYRPTGEPMHVRRLVAPDPTQDAPNLIQLSNIPGISSILPVYSMFYTHAAPAYDQEYLAVWGFKRPEGASERPLESAGGYLSEPWPKPSLIRIRMTLHDSQKRLRNGRTFEFVFRISNQL